jgi:hypothetical protein
MDPRNGAPATHSASQTRVNALLPSRGTPGGDDLCRIRWVRFAKMRSGSTSSHHVKQPISFPRRTSAPGFCNLASLTRIEGWAERRETFGCSAEHPWGVSCASKTRVNALMTRYARRLRGGLASHDAGRSPLGAPPWRFWAPGAALPSPWAPAVPQRRAGAFRICAASSSHPGRSAWRAGSLPPEANGYEPPPQDATPRSAFGIVSRTRPQ